MVMVIQPWLRSHVKRLTFLKCLTKLFKKAFRRCQKCKYLSVSKLELLQLSFFFQIKRDQQTHKQQRRWVLNTCIYICHYFENLKQQIIKPTPLWFWVHRNAICKDKFFAFEFGQKLGCLWRVYSFTCNNEITARNNRWRVATKTSCLLNRTLLWATHKELNCLYLNSYKQLHFIAIILCFKMWVGINRSV